MTEARDLADRFHERWLHVHPFAATMYGIPGYDHLLPDDSERGAAGIGFQPRHQPEQL